MRRTQRYRTHEASLTDLALPDNWPGDLMPSGRTHRVKGGYDELLLPDWIKPEWAPWTRVIIVGRDEWSITGVRHLLARCGAIRLRVLKDMPEGNDLEGVNIAIWLRLRGDGLPELSGYVARLRRRFPQLKHFVVSDALPRAMASGTSALCGVWIAQGRENRDSLYQILSKAITEPSPAGPLLSKILSPAQWRVLLLRSSGMNTASIAEVCVISYKTVSVLESTIRERLGITNRVEYAWLLRCVKLIQGAVPGLVRRARKAMGTKS